MKFSHALIALVATISQAQPIEDVSAASHIEIVPGWKRSLDKRADCTFVVWTGESTALLFPSAPC